MANGVPVRLSARLAASARSAADVQDRSVTEQVEHWARLGQVVEAAISAGTTHRLKAKSHDPELADRLAFATTPTGRAKAAALIKKRHKR
jgi:ParD-like antitoxin of type II bacterial toxin-antitoxin system